MLMLQLKNTGKSYLSLHIKRNGNSSYPTDILKFHDFHLSQLRQFMHSSITFVPTLSYHVRQYNN